MRMTKSPTFYVAIQLSHAYQEYEKEQGHKQGERIFNFCITIRVLNLFFSRHNIYIYVDAQLILNRSILYDEFWLRYDSIIYRYVSGNAMHSMIDLHSFIFCILFVDGCWFIVVVRRCRSLSVRPSVVVHAFEFLRQFCLLSVCVYSTNYRVTVNC